MVSENLWLGTITKWCCVYTLSTQYVTVYIELLHFALSDAILKHDFSSKYKVVDFPRSNKNDLHTGTKCLLLCPS